MKIEVQDDPLTLKLYPWMDTNERYEIVWSEITERWEVIPF